MNLMAVIAVGLLLATLAVLIIGVVCMAIGGKLDAKYSNKLMRLRVIMQALAVLAIAILMFSTH